MSTQRPRTFFHCHPAGEDPGVLLDPECFSCIETGSVEPLDAEVVRSIRDRAGEEEG